MSRRGTPLVIGHRQHKEPGVRVAEFDTITAEHLRTVVGAKWTTFPDCTGAFVAEMDFGTAPEIQDELRRVVNEGFFGYMPNFVRTNMQQSCADWYQRRYGWEVPVEWVRPLPDVLTGFEAVLDHFSKPGTTKVILPTPAYMPFLTIPGMHDREIIQVPSKLVNGRWEHDYDGIDAAFADGGGLLILCNPHNPLGRVYDRDELLKISEIVARHDGRVFSDEIHAPITYAGEQHIPYASVSPVAAGHTVTATSASKAWNLAGLKCAQLILSNDADAERWEQTSKWAEHGVSTFGAIANAAAYNTGEPWLNDVLEYLDGNRKALAELLAEHLPEVGYVMPEGTYLAWLDFRPTGIGNDVDSFFRERARVAVTNGCACGEAGTGHVRFNLAMSRGMLEETIKQMAAAVRAHAAEPVAASR
jgi:cystathionine beta-lyase